MAIMGHVKAIMAVLICVRGCSMQEVSEHRYFDTYAECHAAVDAWINSHSGWDGLTYSAPGGYCISNPDTYLRGKQ
jgi:hypothetical protein